MTERRAVPRTHVERAVQPSLVDRLTDDAVDVPADPQVSWEASKESYEASVKRDLEQLLNTRRTPEPAGDDFPAVRRSVYNFGLPDVTSFAMHRHGDRVRLLGAVQDALATFEPRLAGLRVSLGEMARLATPQVHFTVEGLLRMDPSPERVFFDTVLEIASSTYEVRDGGRD